MVMNQIADLTPKSQARRDYRLIPAKAVQATGCCAMALLLVMATASIVEAQEVASSWDQLRVLVKPHDTVSVTDAAGQQIRRTIALSPALVALREVPRLGMTQAGTSQPQRNFMKDHPVWFGALVGAPAGGIAMGIEASSSKRGYVGGIALMGAGAGAGVGALIGLAVSKVLK